MVKHRLFLFVVLLLCFGYDSSYAIDCTDGQYLYGTSCFSCADAINSSNFNHSVLPRANVADCYQNIGRRAGYYYRCTSICDDKNPTCKSYSQTGETCTEGSYCTGNEFYGQCGMPLGIKGCPSDYPSSHPGAESINDCYKGCPDVTVPKGSQAKFLCSNCPIKSNITQCGTSPLTGMYCPGDNTAVEVYYGKKNTDFCYVHEAQKCPAIGSLNLSVGWGAFVISGNSTYVNNTRVKSSSGASSITDCYYDDSSSKALMVYRKDYHGFFKADDNKYSYKTDIVDGSDYSGYTGISDKRKVAQKCAKYTDNGVTYYYGIDGNNCTKCISPYTDQIYTSVSVTNGIIRVSKTNETEVTFTESGCTYNVPAGSYIEKAKDTKDTACPAGYKCPGGAVVYGNTGKKEACPSGTYSAAGASSCTQCVANTYNKDTGSDKCTPCSGGQSSKTGASKCSSCNSEKNAVTWKSWGTWKSDNTLSGGDYGGGCGVAECNAGEIGPGAKSASVSISGETGSTSCDYTGTCLAGFYNPTAAGSDTAEDLRTITCSECRAGYYCEEGNASEDGESCPTEYPNSAAGSSSINNCYLTTAAGKWVAEKTAAQTDCPAGYYCPGGIQVKYGETGGETACPAGKYQDKTGQTECKKCPAGKYQDETGQTGCGICLGGKYQDETGQTSCKICAVGTYTPTNTDGSGYNQCIPCAKGYYQDNTGQSSCTICPVGTYQDETGKTECKKCPAGTYSYATGATSSTTCTACPEGSYNSSTGKYECTVCETGKTTSSKGATASSQCTACPNASTYVDEWYTPGWAKGTTDNSGYVMYRCTIRSCKSFTNADTLSASGVASASITHNSKDECTHSVSCSPGYHTPKPGASDPYQKEASCTGCAAGYYCTDGKENPCGKDTYSEATQSSCSKCSDQTEEKYPKSDGTTGTKGNETTLANKIEKCYVELASGKYVKDNKTGLVDCPAGYYCPGCKDEADFEVTGDAGWENYIDKDTDNTKCETHTKMYYNQTTGGDFKCPAGTYRNATNGKKPSECTKCKAGATSLAGSTSHTGCSLSNETNFCDKYGCFTLPFFWDGKSTSKVLKIKQNKE